MLRYAMSSKRIATELQRESNPLHLARRQLALIADLKQTNKQTITTPARAHVTRHNASLRQQLPTIIYFTCISRHNYRHVDR